jgi:hypothetical protein
MGAVVRDGKLGRYVRFGSLADVSRPSALPPARLALARAAFKSAFIAFRVIWLDEHQKHPRTAFARAKKVQDMCGIRYLGLT